MSTGIVWQEPAIRAFAHEVATAADELRELAPLLRAIGCLRLPADRAGEVTALLDAVTRHTVALQAALAQDAADLLAATRASAAMELLVTAILRRPHLRAAAVSPS